MVFSPTGHNLLISRKRAKDPYEPIVIQQVDALVSMCL